MRDRQISLPLSGCGSGREELPRVPERLAFDRVSRGIPEKHRGLFARLALESGSGLDHEFLVSITQPVGQRVEFGPIHDDAKVRDGHGVAVDRIFMLRGGQGVRREMHHELVAPKVEVDPALRTPALGAAEARGVELAGSLEIRHRDGEMKGTGHVRHHSLRAIAA